MAQAAAPALERARTTQFRLGGVVSEYVDAVIESWVMQIPDTNPAITEMFAVRDLKPYRSYLQWSGEFAGKYLTGAVQLLRVTHDPELRAYLHAFVTRLVSLQDPEDGYLGPYPKAERMSLWDSTTDEWTWDLWNHYHLMLGLLLWFEDSGDERAFRCARRIADLVCAEFLDSGTYIVERSYKYSTEMNHAVLHGLALLYRRTGTPRYRDLALRIVDEFQLYDRDNRQAGDFVRQALAGTEFYRTPRPRWESLHSLIGLAELYYATGNQDFRTTVERFWWSIAETDRHNNGGFSAGEGAIGNPYHPGSIETCCTVAWIALGVEMLRLTGNSIVADELELSTLNQVVGYQFRDGSVCTYNTPMDGRRVSAVEHVAWQPRPGCEQMICCTANGPRGFGLISDWALMTDARGLILNWYGPSTMTAAVRGTAVTLTQETGYPRDGRIALAVAPAAPTSFALRLRIPYWSQRSAVRVNGVAQPGVKRGRYLTLERAWTAGDTVEIDLDLGLRFWRGERECAGKSSVYAGPLLLALRAGEDEGVAFDANTLVAGASRPVADCTVPEYLPGDAWSAAGGGMESAHRGASVRYRFDGVGVEWRFAAHAAAGIARVSIDGRAVAEVDLYRASGSPAGDVSSWRHTTLGYGRHTLEIAVTGDRRSAARGCAVNVVGIRPLQPQALLEVPAPGRRIRLQDFGTVGAGGAEYRSWLNIEHVQAVPFSRENPGRSWRPGTGSMG